MRAPSVSVVTPACSSATSFTRHTSFATSPPSFREPGAYSRRDQPPRVCMLSILVCRLPVKSPWLNPIEPRWLHGKRAIVEPERTLTAHELMDRVHQHFGCERLELLHQHVR